MTIINTRFLATFTTAIFLIGSYPANAQEGWTDSKWGESDTIGAANYLSSEKVLEAVKLIDQGKVYSLGVEINKGFPAYGGRFYDVSVLERQPAGTSAGPNKLTDNDDILHTWLGIGSQIDGFGHIGIDHVHYNGVKAEDIISPNGLKKFGVENIPPIVTRGVLLDMASYYGEDMLKEGTSFNEKEIREAAESQGVEIQEGSVVLFHTGWLNLVGKDNERFSTGEPGLGIGGAQYLADRGVVAVGADTWALEVIPFEEGSGIFEVHQTLLTKNGVYILENMDTRELANDNVHEFLFVLGQPKMKGAMQMIINPIAIR